jgi:hypothetical protein
MSAPSTLDTNRQRDVAFARRPQRFVGHRRAEVGAADADVDDVRDALARGRRSTRPTRTRSAKPPSVQDLVDVGHHIVPST